MDLNYTLRAKNFKTKKSLGQNFLTDSSIVDFIANFANPDDEILEIGPGIGFVTEQLVKTAKKVVAVEIDKDAIKVLNKNLSKYYNLSQNLYFKTLNDLFDMLNIKEKETKNGKFKI